MSAGTFRIFVVAQLGKRLNESPPLKAGKFGWATLHSTVQRKGM